MNSNPTKKQVWFGWCMYDWANSAFATVVLSTVLSVYFVVLVPDEGARLSIPALTFFFVTGIFILSRIKEEKQPAAAWPTL